jgi:hypothetical protein
MAEAKKKEAPKEQPLPFLGTWDPITKQIVPAEGAIEARNKQRQANQNIKDEEANERRRSGRPTAADIGLAPVTSDKAKLVNMTMNPGGNAGLGLTFTPGGQGGGFKAEAMKPESAAVVADAMQKGVNKLFPLPTERKPATPQQQTDPGEHGGVYKEYTNNDGSRRVFYRDGYYIEYDPAGNITKEHDYGNINNFPSDKRIKDIKGKVSDTRLKNILGAILRPY